MIRVIPESLLPLRSNTTPKKITTTPRGVTIFSDLVKSTGIHGDGITENWLAINHGSRGAANNSPEGPKGMNNLLADLSLKWITPENMTPVIAYTAGPGGMFFWSGSPATLSLEDMRKSN